MLIYPSTELSIIKFTQDLGKILVLCDTGLSLKDECPPISFARTEEKIIVNSTLLDYFDLIPTVDETKPFSFFVGRKLTLREINGEQKLLQLVDRNYNMLELKMKPDIDGILRRKKLVHIKKKMTNKVHYNGKNGR
jgi:hypothetical protein